MFLTCKVESLPCSKENERQLICLSTKLKRRHWVRFELLDQEIIPAQGRPLNLKFLTVLLDLSFTKQTNFTAGPSSSIRNSSGSQPKCPHVMYFQGSETSGESSTSKQILLQHPKLPTSNVSIKSFEIIDLTRELVFLTFDGSDTFKWRPKLHVSFISLFVYNIIILQ